MNKKRGILFCIIGVLLLVLVSKLFIPKWNYPNYKENVTYQMDTFYEQEKNIDEVLFLGTSHCLYAVSPMEIYETEGYTSYNLGTALQSVYASYYMLESAFETQSPKVVVLDASSLFHEDGYVDNNEDYAAWRYVLDNMPLGITKIKAAMTFADLRSENTKEKMDTFFSVVFPMIEYHSRWSELSEADFRDYMGGDSYAAGYCMHGTKAGAGESVETMNWYAQQFYNDDISWTWETIEGEENYTAEKSRLYDVAISDEKIEWLKKIDALCKENNAELLLVKYPVIQNPAYYDSAWTWMRSAKVKEVASQTGITYLDLLYDVDMGINTGEDFWDSGHHLNYNGAKKVSEFLGAYLKENYGIECAENIDFEKQMPLYQQLVSVANLQLEMDYITYLEKLNDAKEDYIICIVANDDMRTGLTQEDMNAMHQLGLKLDYANVLTPGNAYIAYIDGGEIVYEATSNRKLEYKTELEDGSGIILASSGFNTGRLSSVIINGEECAMNCRGANFVVIDKATLKVIDSVTFDTYVEIHGAQRSDTHKNLNEYWMTLKEEY